MTQDALLPVLEKTAQQAVRAGMIIKRIREFVKRSEPKRQPTRVADIVADAVGLAEIEARKRKIRILTEIRSRMPVIHVDPVLIEQVLVNLLKNAAEAMHDAKPNAVDPVIRVIVQRVDGGFVCVSVVDQGPGVDEATAERLFEPFYSTKSDGMGMGLNICRSIIESHRGRLWVVNNIDTAGQVTGATFHCSLPIGEADGPGNSGPEALSHQSTQQTVTGEL
jgi:C4-dicarboxylate-specific signal transduction histidine kinase